MGKEFNNADKGKTFKQGGDMKKMNMGGYAGGGMPMVKGKDGKMVPSFAADGEGKMKKGGMVKKMAGGGMAASKMGAVKTGKTPDGVAVKGKTKGTMITMKRGGKC